MTTDQTEQLSSILLEMLIKHHNTAHDPSKLEENINDAIVKILCVFAEDKI